MIDVKYEGTAITLGGDKYIVPALTLKQVRFSLKDDLAKLQAGDAAAQGESLDAGMRIILAALQRNYPDMTEDKLADLIDLRNFREIIPAVMGISGLVQKGE